MTTFSDEPFAPVAGQFMRGDLGVLEFTHAFQRVMNQVTAERPLRGREVDLFYELEAWETAGWHERPHVVDRLRTLARSLESASDGHAPLFVVYLVELDDGAQLGGFMTRDEAERLLALADEERRHGPVHINAVPIHLRREDWEYDR